jgi:hypothetical protein
MSPPSADAIEQQLSIYDNEVRRAVEAGTVHDYMAKSFKDIVSNFLVAFKPG